ncbi:ClpXP protease specificity-enhancing factor [Ottowia testudinis]|uniref:ClpXP protease specificity-enhancing factor n=1 Tax=Ottowia testudinis TaxID=2816950 RepID=A0A975CJF7_9BURK|nr:ClpXP protease specificity-enhancing factor [Ottowia testudinis]QTD46102.1 ClpXP protease specificity-enhancing factor [Ottowia testudinis]
MMNALESASTRPYLIRALYEWCTDNALTPYIAVLVDDTVQVPREYVQNGEIVLNISFDATSGLKLGNEFVEFKARFGGVAREIMVPMDRVLAIYARESGQGMAFPMTVPAVADEGAESMAQASKAVPVAASDAEASRNGGIQLVVTTEPDDGGDAVDEPPPPASPPQRKRPALKRVK